MWELIENPDNPDSEKDKKIIAALASVIEEQMRQKEALQNCPKDRLAVWSEE